MRRYGNTLKRNAPPLIFCVRAGLFLLGVEAHSSDVSAKIFKAPQYGIYGYRRDTRGEDLVARGGIHGADAW
jgi:hypothetical protein